MQESIHTNRLYYNEQILRVLGEYLRKDGQKLRFCQLLYILNKEEDYFYEEPEKTLARFCATLNDLPQE